MNAIAKTSLCQGKMLKLIIHLINLRNHQSESPKIFLSIKTREIIKLATANNIMVMNSKMMKSKLRVHSIWPFTKLVNKLGLFLKI